jgi:RecA/RadA recombinase
VQRKARLVIVDSVASLVRKEFDNDSSIDRTDFLAKEASLLKCAVRSFTMA